MPGRSGSTTDSCRFLNEQIYQLEAQEAQSLMPNQVPLPLERQLPRIHAFHLLRPHPPSIQIHNAARPLPIFVANAVTSFTLVLEFNKSKLQNLY
ncbi:hypothetical protein ACFX2I_014367 [Malus domestica]